MFPPESWVWPKSVSEWEAIVLRSHEALIGTLVGVLDGRRRTGKGSVGTIVKTYGHPDYLAAEVRFDDGSVELYWYHELRKMEDPPVP